jgi:hypothetical protein
MFSLIENINWIMSGPHLSGVNLIKNLKAETEMHILKLSLIVEGATMKMSLV